MSAIITSGMAIASSPLGTFLAVSDERLRMSLDQWALWDRKANIRPFEDGALWPRSRFSGGDVTLLNALVGQDYQFTGRWTYEADESGGQQQRKIIGVSRDSAGNPLGSCTIDAFVTATDIKVGACVSDTGGYFECPTPFPATNHYLVAYRGGSPDVTGATINTLQPT